MAEQHLQVRVTDSYLECLASIGQHLADQGEVFRDLLEELRSVVIPNLLRFPSLGRPYLDHPPQSAEAMVQLAAMPPGVASALREYSFGEYLVLYEAPRDVPQLTLLSIRHHGQLSFDFAGLWDVSAAAKGRT